MDERSDEILGQIEHQRDQLGRNLSELEDRVSRATNWRTHFDKNPMLVVGAALGGGLLLGAVVGSRTHNGHHSSSQHSYKQDSTAGTSSPSYLASRPRSQHLQQVSEAVDHVKAAMIAFGISKAKEFLSQAVPGLEQHLPRA